MLRFFGFLFFLSFGATIMLLQLQGDGAVSAPVSITIESGMSVKEVARSLRDHGLITSATAFKWYLQSKDIDTDIRTGTFVIPDGSSFAEIVDIIAKAAEAQLSVTIPEGYTVAQIDALLARKGLTETGAVITCARTCDFSTFDFLPEVHAASDPVSIGTRLEGYLFPDTYFIDPANFSAETFLFRQLSVFKSRVIDGIPEITSSERSVHDIIIMASLIERETRTDDERPIVSGILWKRYDADVGLDVDATLRYGIGKITEPLTKTNLEDRNAYNTRRHKGLPPGPIANPGLSSIRAATNPESSDYWYYLHGTDGKIRYGETNDEHNVNKAKYL